jgi:hypothetical protein
LWLGHGLIALVSKLTEYHRTTVLPYGEVWQSYHEKNTFPHKNNFTIDSVSISQSNSAKSTISHCGSYKRDNFSVDSYSYHIEKISLIR